MRIIIYEKLSLVCLEMKGACFFLKKSSDICKVFFQNAICMCYRFIPPGSPDLYVKDMT